MSPPTGADATAITRAILLGIPYPPPGVADTPENKWLWDAIAKDIDAMPGGMTVEIPADWADWPDEPPLPGPGEGPPPKASEPPDVAAASWVERLHPRGPHGRFARKPGSGATPAGPGPGPGAQPVTGMRGVQDFTARAARAAPHLLGGGTEKWDGSVNLFTAIEHPGIAGMMSWDGRLDLLQDGAATLGRLLGAAAKDPRGVTLADQPDPAEVVLHEMIHGVEGGRTEQAAADWDKLPGPDQTVLKQIDQLDSEAADGGAIPHAHRLDEIQARTLGGAATQDRIDKLTAAGLLRKADFSDGITDPATGETTYVPLWLLTPKTRGMFPGDRYSRRDHEIAYQDPAQADIEEGFTELGAIMHFPEYAETTGIGGWETGVLAEQAGHAVDNPVWQARKDSLVAQMQQVRSELIKEAEGPHDQAKWNREISRLTHAITALDDGDDTGPAAQAARQITHLGTSVNVARGQELRALISALDATPSLRHATLAEYGQRLADPARIRDGNTWGHYASRTMTALEWVTSVADAEGRRNADQPGTAGWRRVVELADEINRQGPAGKVPAMAAQVIRAAGKDDGAVSEFDVRRAIHDHWGTTPMQGTVAFADAWGLVAPPRSRPRRRTRPAAAAPGPPPVSAALTPEGQEAERILAWAWADPEARVQQAIGQVDDLARAADGNTPALRDIQSAGTMLARLAGTLPAPP